MQNTCTQAWRQILPEPENVSKLDTWLYFTQNILCFFILCFFVRRLWMAEKSFWGLSALPDKSAVNRQPQVYRVTITTPQWPPLGRAAESNPSSIICWICMRDAEFFQQMFPVTVLRKRYSQVPIKMVRQTECRLLRNSTSLASDPHLHFTPTGLFCL